MAHRQVVQLYRQERWLRVRWAVHAGAAWLTVGLCAWWTWTGAVVPARLGSTLLGAELPFEGCGPSLVGLALCSVSALWWLLARRLASPPSRVERIALRLWWPALLTGAALFFGAWHALSAARTHALARFTQAAAPLVAKAERAPDTVTEIDLRQATEAIRAAVPELSSYSELSLVRPSHRLTFPNQRVAILDGDGRMVRITVCGEPSKTFAETYAGATRERLEAAFGPAQRVEASFDGPWRLAYGHYWRWLDHAPGTRGWRACCAIRARPILASPASFDWKPLPSAIGGD